MALFYASAWYVAHMKQFYSRCNIKKKKLCIFNEMKTRFYCSYHPYFYCIPFKLNWPLMALIYLYASAWLPDQYSTRITFISQIKHFKWWHFNDGYHPYLYWIAFKFIKVYGYNSQCTPYFTLINAVSNEISSFAFLFANTTIGWYKNVVPIVPVVYEKYNITDLTCPCGSIVLCENKSPCTKFKTSDILY